MVEAAKFIIHDVEVRGPAILERAQAPERIVGYWQEFFTAVTNGTMRIWISIAAVWICPDAGEMPPLTCIGIPCFSHYASGHPFNSD